MPVVKKVKTQKERTCSKCGKTIKVGEEVVKNRTGNKTGERTKYFHIKCYKG